MKRLDIDLVRKKILRNFRDFILIDKIPFRFFLSNLFVNLLRVNNEFVVGCIEGFNIPLQLSDPIQRQIYFGLYEQPETKLLREKLPETGIFIDVGANVGYFSLLASALVGKGGSVHTFEPIPKNLQVLVDAIESNKISNIVTNQVAIGRKKGTIELFINDTEMGNASSIIGPNRKKAVIAPIITLGDYIEISEINQVDFIKIDIEGGEFDALSGMEKILRHKIAPDLIVEINPYFLQQNGVAPSIILGMLSDFGYKYYKILNSGVISEVDLQNSLDELCNIYCTKRY